MAACITDWLDGYLARAWRQQSLLGRMLDPIADKLLVGTTLLMLTHDNTIDRLNVAAAVIILCREILVSGLREFLAELNVRSTSPSLPSGRPRCRWWRWASCWPAPPGTSCVSGVTMSGLALLWVAALLTLWTGYDYLKAAVRTAMER